MVHDTPPTIQDEPSARTSSPSIVPPVPGIYHNACSFFDDASKQELSLLDLVDGCAALPSSIEASVPIVSDHIPVLDPTFDQPKDNPPSPAHPSHTPSLDSMVPPPSIFSESDFPPLPCPQTLVNTSPSWIPVSSPSFADPSLQKSLEIFSS